MIKTALTVLLLCLGTSLRAEETPPNWYQSFLFENPSFTYEFIRTLGYASSGGADLGESIATARAIQENNIYSWKDQWQKTAERIEKIADRMKKQGHLVSAKEAFWRASNYYRTAGFFLAAPKDQKQSTKLWGKSVDCFAKGAAFLPYFSNIRIPYKNTTLPGFLLKNTRKEAPLLIVHTGFDGTKEELFFEVGQAAYARGYHVLIFEGPGQGEVIKKQGLPFRYDWEEVVAPVVDYTIELIHPPKIALMGISLGGYLAARAACFEHRLSACILNGGIYDMSASILNTLPQDLQQLLEEDPHAFNEAIFSEMARSTTPHWFFNNAMWTLNVKTPAEVVKTFQLYTLKGIVQQIQCPTLVIDSEDDLFFEGQPQQVFNHLKSPRTLLQFSAETTGQAHCQMGALQISNEEVFAWLDRTLKWELP